MRLLRPAVRWVLIAAVFTALGGAAHATEPPVRTTPKAVVWIEPIGDSGGAGEKMGDGETLALRFTRGLQTALEAEAKERFDVRVTPRPGLSAGPPRVRFVLRGGLSRVQDADGSVSTVNQPFLCIVRLFQESVPEGGGKVTRRLIGQWAGTARGLRDLTGNLIRDPRVHVFGLAGELSRRIRQIMVKKIDPSTAVSPPAPVSPADTDSPPAVLMLEGAQQRP